MNILMLGDICGQSGRRAVESALPDFLREHQIDVCVANGENAAGGLGIDHKSAAALLNAGVQVITLGNHSWAKQDFIQTVETFPHVIRPLNGPADWPGAGYAVLTAAQIKILMINLQGRVFMDALDDPFQTIQRDLPRLKAETGARVVLVDFHAEATSEKKAMGYFLMDQVTAVVGTHTHVQTADEQILGNGTGYITDLGMCGPSESIIGMDIETSLRRFVCRLPTRYTPAEGEGSLQGVLLTVDRLSGQTTRIRRVYNSQPVS